MRNLLRAGWFVGAALLLGSPAARAFVVEGAVRSAVSGEPIANVGVEADCFGCFGPVALARTDASGRYSIRLPGAGLYFVHTDAAPAWTNKVFSDTTCADSSCFRPLGIPEPIELVEEGSVAVVDFALDMPARLFLRAVDAVTGNAPLVLSGDTRVSMVRDGAAFPLPWDVVPAAGAEMSLPAGPYRIAAANPMYATTRYPDHPCGASCGDLGELVTVAPGERIEVAIVMRPRYGWIRGRVTDLVSGAPLAGVRVGTPHARTVPSDANGAYEIVVPIGPTTVRAGTSATHVGQGFPGVHCPYLCGGPLGTVDVGTLEVTSGIDFALHRTGAIAGKVTRRDGTPIAGALVSLSHPDIATQPARTDADGRYVLRAPPATYEASAQAPGFLMQLHAGRSCAPTCPRPATPVSITADSVAHDIDFALDPGGRFLFYIIASDTNRLAEGLVSMHREDGTIAATVRVVTSGTFSPTLPLGRYRLVARVDGYAPTAYGAGTCADDAECWRAASPLELTTTQSETWVNVHRPPGGRVVLRALDAETHEALESPSFEAVFEIPRGTFWTEFARDDGSPLPPNSVRCRLVGFDHECDVPAGVYRVTIRAPAYGDVRWPDTPCEPTCERSAGAPIVVRSGESQVIEARLPRHGQIGGRVHNARGAFLHPVRIEVFDSVGALVRVLHTQRSVSIEHPDIGRYGGEFAPGRYFLRARSSLEYVDQLFAGFPCPEGACNPLLGTPVDVAAHVDTPVDFNLGESQILLQTGFE